MVEITKYEAEKIREVYPHAEISKTCRFKNVGSRGKRYLSENQKYIALLNEIRNAENVIYTYGE